MIIRSIFMSYILAMVLVANTIPRGEPQGTSFLEYNMRFITLFHWLESMIYNLL